MSRMVASPGASGPCVKTGQKSSTSRNDYRELPARHTRNMHAYFLHVVADLVRFRVQGLLAVVDYVASVQSNKSFG